MFDVSEYLGEEAASGLCVRETISAQRRRTADISGPGMPGDAHPEVVEGSNDSIHFGLCYMSPRASVAFTGRKGHSWPSQIGLTASCWAAPEVAEQLEDLTIRFFRSIGLTNGFVSMEYKRDQRASGFRFVSQPLGSDGQVEISSLSCWLLRRHRPAVPTIKA
ncbi:MULTISPECIES: hypothetical protein [Bradyrhizobium]|uniref:hypothetical protein n=1 Tax=Bradyrhizobium elkanii TaxID=29448 RepID=UPI000489C225|nr:hypothetical protein [Bradyrhizobium elkanii]